MIRHELDVRAVWSNNAADRVGGGAIDLPMWRPFRSLPMQTFHQARSMATFLSSKGSDCGSLVGTAVLFVCDTGPSSILLWWWIPREWQGGDHKCCATLLEAPKLVWFQDMYALAAWAIRNRFFSFIMKETMRILCIRIINPKVQHIAWTTDGAAVVLGSTWLHFHGGSIDTMRKCDSI